jgi:hypothetical protein
MTALAGERQRRTARDNGVTVLIVDGEAQGLDLDGGRWYLVCEKHDTWVPCDTFKLARWHAPNPSGWCEDCAA